jgi:3-oxoacyl-[acyl-carrier protein] reductase
MKKLQNKTAVVTGASRGIGRAIAEKFASEGANVILTYINQSTSLKDLAEGLEKYGVKIVLVQSDASLYIDAQKLIGEVHAQFGRIDILVNNVGITRDSLLLRMTEAAWDEVIDTNLKSVFNTLKAVTPIMLKQHSGSIINLSSIVGMDGNKGQANYAASKAGIIGITKSLALELGSRNIRCNVIAPGFIDTDMTKELNRDLVNEWIRSIPLQRMGSVDDVASCALFLASDDSAYITGQVIRVDGGLG